MANNINSNELYTDLSYKQSILITKHYSTSFSLSLKLLRKDIRPHIYAIYALVRVADELVDTLRPSNMQTQLNSFIKEVEQAMQSGSSTNMVIHAYITTARKYNIPSELLKAFFASMAMDITKYNYSKKEYQTYIYGSAQVVGLMCLWVFVNAKKGQYSKLKSGAMALGSAFQKVNFLRDIKSDESDLKRVYFPELANEKLKPTKKAQIEQDILADLTASKAYIQQLPKSSRYGVHLAYYYYQALYKKICRADEKQLYTQRIRVSNIYKLYLFARVSCQKLFGIIS